MRHNHWIHSFLSDADLQSIKQSVFDAEAKTSGEIVPVFVSKSSTTRHILWMLIPVSILGIYPFFIEAEVPVAVALLVGALVAAIGLSKWSRVQRLMVPIQDRVDQCNRRAELEFYENDLSQTEGGTGVLIFVSLLERRIVLLADQGINEKVKPETWNNLVDMLEVDLKKGRVKEGFQKAIRSCGDILSTHFPRDPNDVNELPDQLVIKE